MEALEQEAEKARTSLEAVTTGLQHELERAQDKVKDLEGQVIELKGQIQRQEADKTFLQKQLELITLRLPAPKEGFWSRIFGRKKEAKA